MARPGRRPATGTGGPALAAAAMGAALGMALAGCAPAPVAPPAAPTAVYPLPARPVRPDEVPLVVVPTREGDTVVELIGLTTGMESVLGSHAEWPATGQFVRIRLVVANDGRNTVPFDANRQLLRTTDGGEHAPDSQAMLIKRQPGRIDIGAGDRLEFDLYYDVPAGSAPRALQVFGGPSLADFSDRTGVEVPITRAGG